MFASRIVRKGLFSLLTSLLIAIVASSSLLNAMSAEAITTRYIALDCANSAVDGVIYLFPGDSLSIQLTNCTNPQDQPQLYTDASGDPVYFNTSAVQLTSSSGAFILNADGNYNTSGGTFLGQTSGRWLPNRDGMAYAIIGSSYLEIKLVTTEMTTVTGKSLLSEPQLTLPAVMPAEQSAFDAEHNTSSVFTTFTFTVHKSGDYFLREMQTSPDTFFTDDASGAGSSANAINPIFQDVALYSNFDKTDTQLNRIALADVGAFEGSYTNSGYVFGKFSPSMSTFLEPGTYTLVMFVHFPIEMWNATDGSRLWGAAIDESANFEIWGPPGGLTAPAALASTGQAATLPLTLSGFGVLGLGLFIQFGRRRKSQPE